MSIWQSIFILVHLAGFVALIVSISATTILATSGPGPIMRDQRGGGRR